MFPNVHIEFVKVKQKKKKSFHMNEGTKKKAIKNIIRIKFII